MRKWEDLPENMRLPEVLPYYDILAKKKVSLFFKRVFDFVVALILLIILAIPMVIIAIWIKADSKGPVFYKQERVTTYGKRFRIHKFRTMCDGADKIGTAVTVGNDSRITEVGAKLRRVRLDELPQVFDVIKGDMSFVGTRPEAVKYVEKYKPEFMATLLMPAGITNEACINFKDEADLLDGVEDADKVYIEEILPRKMQWNLLGIKEYGFWKEIWTMFRTFFVVLGIVKPKEFEENERVSRMS